MRRTRTLIPRARARAITRTMSMPFAASAPRTALDSVIRHGKRLIPPAAAQSKRRKTARSDADAARYFDAAVIFTRYTPRNKRVSTTAAPARFADLRRRRRRPAPWRTRAAPDAQREVLMLA